MSEFRNTASSNKGKDTFVGAVDMLSSLSVKQNLRAMLNKEFRQRVLSALLVLPVVISYIWLGGWYFGVALIAACIVLLYEWSRLWSDKFNLQEIYLRTNIGVSTLMFLMILLGEGTWSFMILFGCIVFYIYRYFRYGDYNWVSLSGIMYFTIPLVLLNVIRAENGFNYTMWLMCVVWSTDIGAYFAGRIIGGAKIAPQISPNKTWAGLGGGVFLAIVTSLIFRFGFGVSDASIPFTVTLAVFSQVGDFFESWLKRKSGVKDTGNFMAGHGGLMDRMDGLLFAVVLYFFLHVI